MTWPELLHLSLPQLAADLYTPLSIPQLGASTYYLTVAFIAFVKAGLCVSANTAAE